MPARCPLVLRFLRPSLNSRTGKTASKAFNGGCYDQTLITQQLPTPGLPHTLPVQEVVQARQTGDHTPTSHSSINTPSMAQHQLAGATPALVAAFVQAKAALDAVPLSTPSARAAAWRRLCAAAVALGQLESAYSLYLKGFQETGCHELSAGRLPVLEALAAAQPPPPAAGPAGSGASPGGPAGSAVLPDHLERYRRRYWRDGAVPPSSRRVFCVSDLHVDRTGARHMEWVGRISQTAFRNDVLIVAGGRTFLNSMLVPLFGSNQKHTAVVLQKLGDKNRPRAGDVADSLAATKAALAVLRPKFGRVVYVNGNHGRACLQSYRLVS